MKCKLKSKCTYYSDNSYTCNSNTDKSYCGVYRKSLFKSKFLILILVSILIGISGVSFVSAVGTYPAVDPNMVLYYHFNNDSSVGENYSGLNYTIYDYSGSRNNGTANNTLFQLNTGILNDRSIYFNGVNSSVKPINQIFLPQNGSISIWFKQNSNNNNGAIFSSNMDVRFTITGTSGVATGYLSTALGNPLVNIAGSNNYNLNLWNNLIMTWNVINSTTKNAVLYLNGNPIGNNNFTYSGSSSKIIIGAFNTPSSQFFNGSLDEIIIENKSFSSNEVKQFYNNYIFCGDVNFSNCYIYKNITLGGGIYYLNGLPNHGALEIMNYSITIDGNDSTIYYENNQYSSFGVFINNFSNIHIKNLTLIQVNSTPVYGRGIYMLGNTNNILIENLNISTFGDGATAIDSANYPVNHTYINNFLRIYHNQSMGIHSWNITNSTIFNNTIISSFAYGQSFGIYFDDAVNNNISNNNIYIYNNSGSYGIHLEKSSYFNDVRYNFINISVSNLDMWQDWGIGLEEGSSFNNVFYNNIISNCNHTHGIALDSNVSYNNIYYNNITLFGLAQRGIRSVQTSPGNISHNNIFYNNINIFGDNSNGINFIGNQSAFNNVSYNNINIYSANSYGLLSNELSHDNLFYNNIVNVTNIFSFPLSFQNSNNNYESNNYLISNNYTVWLDSSTNNTFESIINYIQIYSKTVSISYFKGLTNALLIFSNSSSSINSGDVNISLNPNEWVYVFDNYGELSRCNSTNNFTILNFTFKNELNNSEKLNGTIQFASFNYFPEGLPINVSRNYNFTSTELNNSFPICITTTNKNYYINYTLDYTGNNYGQRTIQNSLTLYQNTTNKIELSILNSSNVITFQLINSFNQPINSAYVYVLPYLNDTVLASGYTDSGGIVQFLLNNGTTYRVYFSKSGYDSYSITQSFDNTFYTITLSGLGVVVVTPPDYGGGNPSVPNSVGVTYSTKPVNTWLNNGTNYNFNYTINSGTWTLTNWGFNLTDSLGNLINATSSTDASGGTLNINASTSNYTKVIMNFYYTVNGTTINLQRVWLVLDTSDSSYSISHGLDDTTNYISSGLFGLTLQGLSFIVFFIIFIGAGVLSYKFGLTSPVAILGFVFAMVWFFDVSLGWIPTPIGAIHNFATILIGIVFFGFVIKEVAQ